MGFRTTMTTEHIYLKIPQEFLDKYPYVRARTIDKGEVTLPLSLDHEIKFYDDFEETEIFKDLQKLIVEQDVKELSLVLFHECEGMTKVVITHTEIFGLEPTAFKKVERVEHDYCYGCSDYKELTPPHLT